MLADRPGQQQPAFNFDEPVKPVDDEGNPGRNHTSVRRPPKQPVREHGGGVAGRMAGCRVSIHTAAEDCAYWLKNPCKSSIFGECRKATGGILLFKEHLGNTDQR